jgi:hypothetical protein
MKARRLVAAVAVLFVSAAVGTAVRAKDGDKNDLQAAAVQDATVHFGQHQPQTPDPAPVGAAVTHFLFPDDVTIHKNGTVTFVVNGGGHGIAIHAVSKDTTRADIAEDLCDGATPENADPIVDRRNRAAVCNGTVVTNAVIDGTPVSVVGTQNLDYMITDGKGNLVIEPGFNVTVPTTPPTVLNNPRLDDPDHSFRVVATSGASPGDTLNPAAIAGNRAGAFLTGSANPATPGNRIQVQFMKTGRYLVICMNRAHSLNDHMFGFVNVVDAGEGQQ